MRSMKEFILLLAFLMALVALSIDAMLPALPIMGEALQITEANGVQYIVTFIFIGMTFGQLFYGPLSDSIGRKPALYSGLALFIIGSLICHLAQTLPLMLLGRLVQGIGASAPRIITTAIVRDRFHGRDMASVMSMVMGVFILVPAIAPTLGLGVMQLIGWRGLFLGYIGIALIGALWAHTRLEETLAPEHRHRFDLRTIAAGFREAACTRITLGYTLCSGIAYGAMLSYLNSTQQIFHDIFHVGDDFPFYFGSLALAIGSAFFLNSTLVRTLGMRHITRTALITFTAASALFLTYLSLWGVSLWPFMAYAALSFFCLGLTFGNMGAMALEPMGHIAGLASAFLGAVSSAISLPIGIVIGQHYNGTLYPLAIGFLCIGLAAWLVMEYTEYGARKRLHPPAA